VHLAGYVATEPRFKKVAGDTSSVRLRVAYTARRRDKESGEWTDGPTSFVTIQCWRTLADNVNMSVHKGEPVLITGRLQIAPRRGGRAQDRRGGRGGVRRPRPDPWGGPVLAHPVARGHSGG
jgi:single-stranded DNA-binding protein